MEETKVAEPVVDETIEDSATDSTEGKMYTQADFLAEVDKRSKELTNVAVQERLKREKEKAEIDKQKAVEDAIKKEKMTEEERKHAELDELKTAYNDLLDKSNKQEKYTLISNKLGEAGLVSDDLLIEALSNNLDNLDPIIEKLKVTINEQVDKQVNEKLKSSNVQLPKNSGMDMSKTSVNKHVPIASQIGVPNKNN